jgi:3-oxoacyl-[acyl-carrier protein] reductase
MELSLKQKNVLITGSSRGIGFSIAQAFLDEGANVMVNARGEINLELFKAKNKNQLSFVTADVLTPSGVAALAKNVSKIFQNKLDVLVCNVGSGKSVAPGMEKNEDWKKSFEINFFSTTNVIEEFKKTMTPNTGNIICISSICGLEVYGAPLTYSAAKAALNSYVVGLSRVLANDGIRINAVAPGNILFKGSTWEKKIIDNEVAVKAMLEREVPLKRFGSAEDVSNMVLFLASEKASFVTGAIIVVDGGQVRSW